MFNFFKKKVRIESEEDYYNYLIEESKQDKLNTYGFNEKYANQEERLLKIFGNCDNFDKTIKMILISDTHNCLNIEEFRQFVDNHKDYDVCILLGDHNSYDIEKVLNCIDKSKLYGLLGNHDYNYIDEYNINIDNIHNINIVTGTITSPPDDDSDIVNKKYVDDNSIDKTKPLDLLTGDSDTYSLKINKGIILNDKEIINSSGDVIINNNLTFKSNDDTNYNIHMDDTKTNLIIPDNTLIQIDSYDDLGNHAIANKAYVDSKVFDNTQTLTLTTESEPSIKADNNIETEKAIKSLDLITTNIKYDAGTTLATISTDTITFKSNVYIENKYLLLTNMSTFAIGPSISAPVFTIKYDSASSKINMNGNINMSGDKIAINNIEMSVDAATPTSLKFTYTDSSNKVYTGSITLTAQA